MRNNYSYQTKGRILKMKRTLCCIICVLVLCSCIGCNQLPTVVHGNYYAVGNYEYGLTPYILLIPSKNEFDFGGGSLISATIGGTYRINEDRIIASTKNCIFQFEIKDKYTLVLVENGNENYFKVPLNTQFVFSKDLK